MKFSTKLGVGLLLAVPSLAVPIDINTDSPGVNSPATPRELPRVRRYFYDKDADEARRACTEAEYANGECIDAIDSALPEDDVEVDWNEPSDDVVDWEDFYNDISQDEPIGNKDSNETIELAPYEPEADYIDDEESGAVTDWNEDTETVEFALYEPETGYVADEDKDEITNWMEDPEAIDLSPYEVETGYAKDEVKEYNEDSESIGLSAKVTDVEIEIVMIEIYWDDSVDADPDWEDFSENEDKLEDAGYKVDDDAFALEEQDDDVNDGDEDPDCVYCNESGDLPTEAHAELKRQVMKRGVEKRDVNKKREVKKRDITEPEVNKKRAVNKRQITTPEVNQKREVNKREIATPKVNQKRDVTTPEVNKRQITTPEVNKREVRKREVKKRQVKGLESKKRNPIATGNPNDAAINCPDSAPVGNGKQT